MKLFTNLTESRIKSNETSNLYAARLLQIASEIKFINEYFFYDTYVSFQLLRYLLPQYDSIVQSILRWSEKFKYNQIVTELVFEET